MNDMDGYGDDYGDDYGGYGDEDDFDQALKGASGNFGDFENFADEGGYGQHRTDDEQNREEIKLIGHLVEPLHADITKREHIAELMR